MNKFFAGTSENIITPPVGVDLLGYSPRKAEGVHDDLKATALVLDDGKQKIVICSFDLCLINESTTNFILRHASTQTGIPAENIMLTTTHTHSGPYLECDNPLNAKWRKEFEYKAVQAIVEAAANIKAAEIGFAVGSIEGVGGNRRDKNGPVDRSVNVIKVVDAMNNDVIAVILNHACHATTLDVHNLLITADYPGFARDYIQNAFPENPNVLFLNGACGDINPGGYSAEDSAKGVFIPNRNFERAQQIGKLLGQKTIDLIKNAEIFKPECLQSKLQTVAMPLKDMEGVEQTEKILTQTKERYEKIEKSSASEEEKYQTWRKYFYALLNNEQAEEFQDIGPERVIYQDIHAISIDDNVLVGFPGELFTNIGKVVKKSSPFRNTLIASYVNECIGYFPTVEDLKESDGYEVNSCHFTPTAIQNLQDTAYSLIQELHNSWKQ